MEGQYLSNKNRKLRNSDISGVQEASSKYRQNQQLSTKDGSLSDADAISYKYDSSRVIKDNAAI